MTADKVFRPRGLRPSPITDRDHFGMGRPANPVAQSRFSPLQTSKRELCHGHCTTPSSYFKPPGPRVREKPRCGHRLRATQTPSPVRATIKRCPLASTPISPLSGKSWSEPMRTSVLIPVLSNAIPRGQVYHGNTSVAHDRHIRGGGQKREGRPPLCDRPSHFCPRLSGFTFARGAELINRNSCKHELTTFAFLSGG